MAQAHTSEVAKTQELLSFLVTLQNETEKEAVRGQNEKGGHLTSRLIKQSHAVPLSPGWQAEAIYKPMTKSSNLPSHN